MGKTDDGVELDSAFFGDSAVLMLDDDGRLVAKEDGAATGKQVLSEDAYSGLHLKDLTFKKVEKDPPAPGAKTGRTVFVFEFTVCSDLSDNLWHGSVSAAPIID